MLSSADWVKSARFAARSAEYDGVLWRRRTAVAAYVVVDVGAVEIDLARRGIRVVAVINRVESLVMIVGTFYLIFDQNDGKGKCVKDVLNCSVATRLYGC